MGEGLLGSLPEHDTGAWADRCYISQFVSGNRNRSLLICAVCVGKYALFDMICDRTARVVD
jgi:hypothetical protein